MTGYLADDSTASASLPSLSPQPERGPLDKKRIRIQHLQAAKEQGVKISMLTAYDALTASIFDRAGIDMILVGDSLGNVVLGYSSTLPVTLDDMERATAAVARAASRALIVADLPFGAYEASPEQAFTSAARLMKAGAHAVKLEGGAARAETVTVLTGAGIPVVAHLGYTPQSENSLGGPRMQGRGEGAKKLMEDARALEAAGAFAVVFEMVPESVATQLTKELSIITIGIGAGPYTDGQVLVWSDMAGMTSWSPSFARRFAELGRELESAAGSYISAVRSGDFPGSDNYRSE